VKSLSDDNLTWYNRPLKTTFHVGDNTKKKQISSEALASVTLNAHAWSVHDVIKRLQVSKQDNPQTPPPAEVMVIIPPPIVELIDEEKPGRQTTAAEVTSASNQKGIGSGDEQVEKLIEKIRHQTIEFLVYEIEPILVAEHISRRRSHRGNSQHYLHQHYQQQKQQHERYSSNCISILPSLETVAGISVADGSTSDVASSLLQRLTIDSTQLHYLLTNIVGDFRSDEFLAFCRLLRQLDVANSSPRTGSSYSSRSTADFLEALDLVVKVIRSRSPVVGCSVEGEGTVQPDVDVLYVDINTKAVVSFNEVERLKRARRRRSRLVLDENSQQRHSAVVVRDTADRYVPMLSVKFDNCTLCEAQVRRIERLLDNFNCIRDFSVTHVNLDPPSVLRLSRVIQLNTELYSLQLTDCQLADDGLMFLAYALRRNSSVHVLNVSGNQLTVQGCSLLARSIARSRCVTELDLSDNNISDAGCVSLAGALLESATAASLRKLYVRNNAIGCVGAMSLFTALRRNAKLTTIDVSGNEFGDDPIVELSQILLVNRTLRQFWAVNCRLSDTSCLHLSRTLKTNTILRSVRLDSNACIRDEGVDWLADSLKYNRTLEELCLSRCGVSHVGLSCLLQALTYNFTITTIDLRFNVLSSSGSRHLCGGPDDSDGVVDVGTWRDLNQNVCNVNNRLKILLN
jgi:Ran GTPase-activating protein (RanGAP) involved in mRNA processing and transport